MNPISSRGLLWAKQPLALFALLISQMGKLTDTWHQIKISWKNFINVFLLSSWDFSSVLGSEHHSLEMCWKWWALSVCINFIFCLFKDWKFWPWQSIPGSHSWQLTLDEACVAPGLFREGCELPPRQKEGARPLFLPKHHTFLFLEKFKVFAHSSVCLLRPQTHPAHLVPPWDWWSNQGPWGLSGTARSHLDVTETRTCQGQVTVPFPAPAMDEGFSESLNTESLKWSKLKIPFFDTCPFNHRLKPTQIWDYFSGPICNCGAVVPAGKEELWKADLPPKLGGPESSPPQL